MWAAVRRSTATTVGVGRPAQLRRAAGAAGDHPAGAGAPGRRFPRWAAALDGAGPWSTPPAHRSSAWSAILAGMGMGEKRGPDGQPASPAAVTQSLACARGVGGALESRLRLQLSIGGRVLAPTHGAHSGGGVHVWSTTRREPGSRMIERVGGVLGPGALNCQAQDPRL